MTLTLNQTEILIPTISLENIVNTTTIKNTYLQLIANFGLRNIPVFFINFSSSFFRMQIINKNKSFVVNKNQDTSIARNVFASNNDENKFNLQSIRTLVTNPQPIELNLTLRIEKTNIYFRALDIFLTFSADAINSVRFHYISGDFVAFGMQLSSYIEAKEEGNTNTVDLRFTSRDPVVEEFTQDTTPNEQGEDLLGKIL